MSFSRQENISGFKITFLFKDLFLHNRLEVAVSCSRKDYRHELFFRIATKHKTFTMMSDFIADIREPQIPTVCDDLDSDEFVAELRPQRLNFKPDHAMEMNMLDCHERFQFPSDEHVQGLLSTSQFSTEKTAKLIESSTLTLIQKLLYGHNVASITGQIKIELGDTQQQHIVINFDHQDESSKVGLMGKESSQLRDMSNVFNVRVRSGDRDDLHPQQSTDFTPLKFADHPYQTPRRGSDADSGYGGKISDYLADQIDEKTLRVSSDERSCSSVDSVCTILNSELRYQREPSCEKSTAGHVSPASDTWEELDEESSALVIDESYDPEASNEKPNVVSEMDGLQESNANQQRNTTDTISKSTLPTTIQHESERDAGHIDSQQRLTSLPVDLSGDSEDPRGCLSLEAKNLVICSGLGVQSLVCRLCHNVTKSPLEMSKHAASTHGLFACMYCFQSFSSKFHLESHLPVHSRKICASPNQHAEDMDAQVPELYASSQDIEEEQVLDLSIKKPRTVDEERDRKDADLTEALSNRPGQNVSRDGYGQPSRDSAFSTVTSSSSTYCNQPTNELMRLQSVDGFSKGPISIKIEPGCKTQNSPRQLLSLPGTPIPHLVEFKAEELIDRSQIEKSPRMLRENFTRFSQTPQGKHLVRFSPYSRERLAELTSKFIASRKIEPSTENNKKVQISAGMAIMDDEISREVSMSETALKNRVNAFVKNGGHQVQVETSPRTNNTSGGETNKKHSEARAGSRHGAGRLGSSGSFTCTHEGCGEEFTCFQALERHSVDSHGRYLCEHCGKTFTARPNRDRHVRYHTGERPYKCDLCPMAFFRGDDLKYHRTTRHPAAEPFVCKRCNRNFTWTRDLERHQRHCRCKA